MFMLVKSHFCKHPFVCVDIVVFFEQPPHYMQHSRLLKCCDELVQDDPKLPDDGGERYPNLKEEVGGSIPDCETSYVLDTNLPCGQLPHVL